MDKKTIEQILPTVRMPARYIGNELNSVHKDWDKAKLKVALAYPDTYEVGMSNLAIQILYYIFNSQEAVLAERVFCPWPDMEEALKKNDIPLFSLESWKPLADFDLIGLSLGHELTYSNMLTILSLAKIPFYSKDRENEKYPLIMAGGPSTYNPAPVADFIDFFVIGEAEEVLPKIVKILKEQPAARTSQLAALAEIPGVYVPSLNNRTQSQHVKDLDTLPFPEKPIIPFVEAIHDRAVLEIMRGCKWKCRFCHAGWTGGTVRTKDREKLKELGCKLIKNTGYDELSLISLSTSDYPGIGELASDMMQELGKKKVNIAVPSLRLNSFSIKLAKEILKVRQSGVTLAPEAGTQRLRDVIGKKMTEEDILEGVRVAFSEGMENIKLYFMLGLPTEKEEDLLGICELSKKIIAIGRAITKRARITVNLSTFIPKSHTPFQWERQISIEETLEKQGLIKQNLKAKGVTIRWHQAQASWLEGVFSRGDRNLAKALLKAWELGARMDAWTENFKVDLWNSAFKAVGIDPNQYLQARDLNAPLPWDMIDTGVPKETLLQEREKAYAAH